MFILCINQNKLSKKYKRHNQINSVIKMDTIFLSSENSKPSEQYVLIVTGFLMSQGNQGKSGNLKICQGISGKIRKFHGF